MVILVRSTLWYNCNQAEEIISIMEGMMGKGQIFPALHHLALVVVDQWVLLRDREKKDHLADVQLPGRNGNNIFLWIIDLLYVSIWDIQCIKSKKKYLNTFTKSHDFLDTGLKLGQSIFLTKNYSFEAIGDKSVCFYFVS